MDYDYFDHNYGFILFWVAFSLLLLQRRRIGLFIVMLVLGGAILLWYRYGDVEDGAVAGQVAPAAETITIEETANPAEEAVSGQEAAPLAEGEVTGGEAVPPAGNAQQLE